MKTNKQKMLEIVIPFTGFCDTEAGGLMDNALEMEAYNAEEEDGLDPAAYDLKIDMKGFMNDYAEAHVDMLEEEFKRDHNLAIKLKFLHVESPREYNFVNDAIIGEISEEAVVEMYTQLLFDQKIHGRLRRIVKRDFTSRSGFTSFYPSKLDDWLDKPVQEWDCVMLGSLLEAYVEDYVEELVPGSHEMAYQYIERVEKGDE